MKKFKYIIWFTIQIISVFWFFLVVAGGIAYMFERDGDLYGVLSIFAVIITIFTLSVKKATQLSK